MEERPRHKLISPASAVTAILLVVIAILAALNIRLAERAANTRGSANSQTAPKAQDVKFEITSEIAGLNISPTRQTAAWILRMSQESGYPTNRQYAVFEQSGFKLVSPEIVRIVFRDIGELSESEKDRLFERLEGVTTEGGMESSAHGREAVYTIYFAPPKDQKDLNYSVSYWILRTIFASNPEGPDREIFTRLRKAMRENGDFALEAGFTQKINLLPKAAGKIGAITSSLTRLMTPKAYTACSGGPVECGTLVENCSCGSMSCNSGYEGKPCTNGVTCTCGGWKCTRGAPA